MAKLGDDDFRQLVKARKVDPPRVLYKYLSQDSARIFLESGRIRFQSPIRYNDPFDSQWNVFWPLHTKEAISYERDILRKALTDVKAWPANSNRAYFDKTADVRQRFIKMSTEQRTVELEKYIDNLDTLAKSVAQRIVTSSILYGECVSSVFQSETTPF